MSATCLQCSAPFAISAQDVAFYTTMGVPSPKQCPTCRLQRRLCERNTRSLYYRKCDLTGKQIISQYGPNQAFPVYGTEAWLSDDWDALSYGREFDFSQSFFPQFAALQQAVPHMALFNTPGTMENSDYNNCTGYLKNCYLLSESDVCEDCYYSNLLKKCKNVVDSSVCYDCEECYECIDCIGCQRLQYAQDCQGCHSSLFLKNCIGCSDCIGCVNQRHKQHMMFNKQYTKAEYEKQLKLSALDTRAGIQTLAAHALAFFKTQPHPALRIEQSENCSGDRLYESKNAFQCFDVKNVEDCRYCARLSLNCRNCMDFNSWGQESELVYQCSACGDRVYNSAFCSTCASVKNAQYCFECMHCSDVFGCCGLRNKQFCIFNVQYSAEEYRALREKIITHMKKTGEYGEYFPMNLCPFAYNESFAPDFFPLTKAEVESRAWRWQDEQERSEKYLGTPVALAERTADVSDDICKSILRCAATGQAYKIIPQELAFYRSLGIPLPEQSPDERHRRRIAKRNPYTLWTRQCAKCQTAMETTYAPERPEIVYCEQCYLEAVY